MNIAMVARNTFRESTRDRVLAGVGIAGLALILMTLPLGFCDLVAIGL
jgi:hypothetical protein